MGRSILNEKPPPNLPEGSRIKDLKDFKGTTEKNGKERKNRKERFFSSDDS
jgi:hypothetical protein